MKYPTLLAMLRIILRRLGKHIYQDGIGEIAEVLESLISRLEKEGITK